MSDRETLGVYARKHDDYAALPVSKDQVDALNMFCAALSPGAHVLDLGCGPGLQARELVQRGLSVSALDATPEFVERARANGIDARLGTFDDLTETNAYDGVFASFSLLHAPKADFPRHLDAIKRALRPGGCLFLGLKLGEGEARDSLGRFYAYYSEAELRKHLEKAGFSLLQAVTGEGKGLSGSIDPYILMTARA
ncbi:class I SAM-dependent methyltransferase [Shimia aestuarii]|uniref:Methyltransferase domain-containing protein n=1 Tax=Shimia aestuarii TaxID=254406 RepID=A0A1I4JJT8_9RHOB|nr:class I SAM-dependent methyltransferase [Shimia aestuarii]SFL66820.1 Methyltransferase domain-containing protein [Shimia aestuarii]